MAHAYTPGLKVTEKTVVRKDRRLPLKGQVMVKNGDTVTSDQIVARTELPGNVQTVNVAGLLGLLAEDVPSHMLKKIGDPISKDETIAMSKGFFGLFKSTCKAPVTGTIESISQITGQVILREPPMPVQVKAYIDGTIVQVTASEGVVVEAFGTFVQGIFGIGGEVFGTVQMACAAPEEELTERHLEGDVSGKVLIGGSFVTEAVLRAAASRGVRAIVVGGFDAADLQRFLGYDLGVAITGSERLGITLVVTEGFGRMAMAGRTFELLRLHAGRRCSVNGATQIRAGVMRPEIVISLTEEEAGVGREKAFDMTQGLQSGSPVRVIRAPFFGRLGEVVDLPPALEAVESGAKVRVLRVRFEDGQEATVPRANVEMIER